MYNELKNQIKQSKSFLSFTSLSVLGQLIYFLTPLIIAKVLNPSGFGSYSLSMMIIFLFTSMFIASSQTPFIIYANEELKKTRKINKAFSIQLIFLLSSIVFFVLLTLLFNRYILEFAQITNIQLFFLFLAYIGIGLKTFIEKLFLALNKKINYSLYGLTLGIFSLIFILLLYYFEKMCLETVFLIYFATPIIALFLFLKEINFNKLLPLQVDKQLFKEMFDFTKWQMMGLTAVYFINWGDNLVLRYFVSIEEIGVYNLGYQMFKGLISLTFILNSYFLPFISQNIDNKEKIRNYLYVKRPKIMLAGTLIIILIFIMTPYLFNIVYGDIYKESVNVLRILLIATMISLYKTFYTPIINSLKKYKFTAIINVIQISVNLLANIILIYLFGFIGAAWGTLISYFISCVGYEIYIKHLKIT